MPTAPAIVPDQGTLVRSTKPTCVVPYLYVRAAVVRHDDGTYVVGFHWTDTRTELDRPHTGGISCGWDRRLADRLATATEAGAVFTSGAETVRDINGASYVAASWDVLGRTLNADLRRKGF